MKKKNIKTLRLRTESIASLQAEKIKGKIGYSYTSWIENPSVDNNSCDWDCAAGATCGWW